MNDYINRQVAIEGAERMVANQRFYDFVGMLMSLPSADVQPVRYGHWIPKFGGKFKGGAYWYDCSKCGHTVAGGIFSGKHFCENCGARMDGET